MSTRLKKIRDRNPAAAERADVQSAVADAETQGALASFASTKAGEVVLKGMRQNLAMTIDSISSGYRTLSHVELMAACAQLEDRIALLRTFTRAPKNLQLIEEAIEELTS